MFKGMPEFVARLRKRCFAKSRLGTINVRDSYTSLGDYVESTFRDATVVELHDQFERFMVVKSEEELVFVRRAAGLAELAADVFEQTAKAGVP